MGRIIRVVIVLLICVCLGSAKCNDVPPQQVDVPQSMQVDDLDPKLDGTEVTVRVTITKLDGISQRTQEGQAPSFAIDTESGKGKNRLSVWIEGELANVLDRLQISPMQENELKSGSTIVATGVLRANAIDPRCFLLSVTKWQNFRVLPSKEKK